MHLKYRKRVESLYNFTVLVSIFLHKHFSRHNSNKILKQQLSSEFSWKVKDAKQPKQNERYWNATRKELDERKPRPPPPVSYILTLFWLILPGKWLISLNAVYGLPRNIVSVGIDCLVCTETECDESNIRFPLKAE